MKVRGEFGENDTLLRLWNLQMELKSPYLNSTGFYVQSHFAGVVLFVFKSPDIGMYLGLNVNSPASKLTEQGKVA